MLFETNEIVSTDHQSCVVDVNLKEHFEEKFIGWDNIERGVLDPNKKNTEKNLMSIWMKL